MAQEKLVEQTQMWQAPGFFILASKFGAIWKKQEKICM